MPVPIPFQSMISPSLSRNSSAPFNPSRTTSPSSSHFPGSAKTELSNPPTSVARFENPPFLRNSFIPFFRKSRTPYITSDTTCFISSTGMSPSATASMDPTFVPSVDHLSLMLSRKPFARSMPDVMTFAIRRPMLSVSTFSISSPSLSPILFPSLVHPMPPMKSIAPLTARLMTLAIFAGLIASSAPIRKSSNFCPHDEKLP